jgi:acetyl-CoA C-acetyltransferase
MTYILGGWQSDFADNWARKGWEIADAFAETVGAGLAAVDLEPKDIETGHVANFAGELFAGQGLLGGFFALAHPDFNGMPTMRHEAACASGSVALLAAAAEVEAGRYDLACVIGIEQMRNVSGEQAAQNLGAAAWAGHEYIDTPFAWPRAFSDLADEYDRRYGLDYRHLMADHLGLTVFESGDIAMGGRLPINPSGGLTMASKVGRAIVRSRARAPVRR